MKNKDNQFNFGDSYEISEKKNSLGKQPNKS